MKARGAALQGAIAVGALALAASTWLRGPPPTNPDGAVIIDLPPGAVQRLVWDDGSHRVEVLRERPGAPGVWVRILRSPSLLAPDGGVDAGQPDGGAADAGSRSDGGTRGDGGLPAVDIAPPAPDRELRGNEAAEKLLEQFSPFTAARALGVMEAAKLRELGLDHVARRLEVWTTASRFGFGISSPVGTGASYLRTEDGRVFILGGSMVQELTAASSRLVDRRVHTFRSEEPERLVIHLGAQSRTLLQRRLGGATKVASESHPDSADAYAQGWVERLAKLVPSDVMGKGEVPPEGPPRVELRVDFERAGQPLGFIEIARAGNAWFARSEHSVGWLRVVGRGEGLVHDAERVVSTP